jgi:hypothetical protein
LEPLEARDVPGFLPPVAYSGNDYPQEPVIADFNGDGRRDVAFPLDYPNAVHIFLGDGTGKLVPGGSYPTGGKEPYGLVAADLNLDGKLDLVAANRYSYAPGLVSVLLGRGDGTFLPVSLFATNNHPAKLVVGDFNHDGRPDVAVTCQYGGSSSVDVLLGNGDGTLQPAVHYAVDGFPNSVKAGDVNGDGRPDLTVDSGVIASFSVLLGNGDGTFQPAQSFPLAHAPWGHALGDVNKDGRLDVIVANSDANSISVFLGNGDGTFQAPADYPTGGSIPVYPVIADFNRDRKPDIAVAHSYSHDGDEPVSVLLGNGDGTFQASQNYPGAPSPGLATGDLNNDRYPDLVVTKWTGCNCPPMVLVLVNDANWTAPLPPAPGRAQSLSSQPTAAGAAHWATAPLPADAAVPYHKPAGRPAPAVVHSARPGRAGRDAAWADLILEEPFARGAGIA